MSNVGGGKKKFFSTHFEVEVQESAKGLSLFFWYRVSVKAFNPWRTVGNLNIMLITKYFKVKLIFLLLKSFTCCRHNRNSLGYCQ